MPLRPTTQRKRSMSHDYCNSSIDKLELIDSSPDRKLTKRDSCDSMHKTSLSGTFLVYSEDDTDESARFREMTAVAANANYRAGVGDDAYAGGVIDGNIINLSTPPNMVLEAHSAASVVAPISVLTKQKFNGSVDPEALVTIFLAANAVATALEPPISLSPNTHRRLHGTPPTNRAIRPHTASYKGVVVFDIPKSANSTKSAVPAVINAHAKQLQAILDKDSILLNLLVNNPDPASGLQSTTNVEMRIINTNISFDPASPPSQEIQPKDRKFNAIIVIAVAVIACLMMPLGFALFLAFRQKQRHCGGQMKSSPIALNRWTHKTGSDNSPQSPRLIPPI